MQARQRRHRARRADEMHRMLGDHLLELAAALELAQLRGDERDHRLEALVA